MKRSSTTLFVQSPGAVTPMPWIDGAPDFSGFTDPTLSVLQTSWQVFIDSGAELEIIPDPEPVAVPPSPDWDGLYTALMISQTYQYFVGVGLTNPKISSELGKIIDAIQYGIILPESPAALPAFQSSLNLFLFVLNDEGNQFPSELKAEVESVLLANNFQSITLP